MNRSSIIVLVAASLCCGLSAAQSLPSAAFTAITPAVTVGETVAGVFACPDANAPACQPQAAFNVGRLTLPASVPFRMADPYRWGGHCSLDILNGRPVSPNTLVVSRRERLAVSGWAFNDVQMPDETMFVLASSKTQYRAPVIRQTPRPDVAKYFGIPTLVGSGYDGDLALSAVPDGIYDIYILMRNRSALTLCHLAPKLQITSP